LISRTGRKRQIRASGTDQQFVTTASERRRRAGLALVLLVLLAGGVGTAAVTLAVSLAEQRYADQAMDRYTDLVGDAVVDEVRHYSDTLLDVAAAMTAQPRPDRTGFRGITGNITRDRLPGVSSLAFLVPATTAEVPAVQSFWRAHGADGLVLSPAGTAAEHTFVVFSQSFDTQTMPAGTDVSPVREPYEALVKAQRTGAVTISQAFVLIKDRQLPRAEQQMSFVITAPVYQVAGTSGSRALRGWVLMAVHGPDFLDVTLAAQSQGAVQAVLDDRLPDGAALPLVPVGTADHDPRLTRVRSLNVGQREWRLTLHPTARLLGATDRRMVGITLATATAITLLLTALVAILSGARNRAMARVDQATAELRSDLERRRMVEERLREREGELKRLALQDPLTGLANRAALADELAAAVVGDEPIGLLLIDLDGFKPINDVYGHAAGDLVLIEFSRLLRDTVRTRDIVARVGGDEFVVLLADIAGPADAVAAAHRVLAAATARPVQVDEDLLPIRASIGVTTGRPGDTPKELQRRADVAMYHAKRAGSHGMAVHDPSMTDRRAADAALADDVAVALHEGQLHLVYQPIIDLAGERSPGAEALLRWRHPRLGLVPPDRFIPIAERTGAINAIGLWVLDQACRQAVTWDIRYISVNLSPRQLQEPTIVHDIVAVLRRTGLAPERLVLEVTESAIVDEAAGIPALRALRSHGIRIAIDDFGTGYSSLQYLTRMPVDILKIDRSFVRELNGTPAGAAVTEAVIRLSQALHLTTIAEGIETAEQAAELRRLGCLKGQGYLYAPPLPPDELDAILFAAVQFGQQPTP
jgi:diguanylate cyclase (GGDEF)-like protein